MLLPLRVIVPLPALVRLPEPDNTPAKVPVLLVLTVKAPLLAIVVAEGSVKPVPELELPTKLKVPVLVMVPVELKPVPLEEVPVSPTVPALDSTAELANTTPLPLLEAVPLKAIAPVLLPFSVLVPPSNRTASLVVVLPVTESVPPLELKVFPVEK